MKSQVLFSFIFYFFIENRLLASNEHLVYVFSKGEEAQGWLATPERVWCQGGRQWPAGKQKTRRAAACGRKLDGLAGCVLLPCVGEEAGLARVTTLERASYQMVSTVNRMVLPSVYLQIKELQSGILQHLKLIFSWRSYIKVAGGIMAW